MNKRLFRAALAVAAVVIGFLAAQSLFRDQRSVQLNQLRNDLDELIELSITAFSQIQNSDRLTEDEKNQYYLDYLSFDVDVLNAKFQALVTYGVYKAAKSKKHDELLEQELDPFIVSQLTLLEGMGKTPLQFVDEMIPLITDSVDELQKRQKEFQKKLNLKLSE